MDVQATLPMPVPVESRQAPSQVPATGFYWWGVDTSTWGTSIAWTDGERHGVRSCVAERGLVGIARLDDLAERTMALARELADEFPPLCVWVEQIVIYGQRKELLLYYATGSAQVAIYAALKDRFAFPVWVEDVPVSTARKRAIGSGKVKKPQVAAWARDLVAGCTADEADALCVAVACQRSVSFEESAA